MSARIVVVANDHVGTRMAGPGIRAYQFATELSRDHEVCLVVPFATDLRGDGFEIVQDDPWDSRQMRRRLGKADVVVAQKLPVRTMEALGATNSIVTIYDLYAPVTIEALALLEASNRGALVRQRLNDLTQRVVLATGDAFVCASERQRDLWLGALMAIGRIDKGRYLADPNLRDFIDVVPFGIDPDEPTHDTPVIKGVVPGIAEHDRVLLWGGGIWDWFDPLTVIRGVERVSKELDEVRLFFMGLRHPNPAVPRMRMERQAVELAGRLGLRDRYVFFNEQWVPFDQRASYYVEADLGVSAHFDDLETRFAFRTRLLDCFWARLPIITTGGDALGEIVDRRGFGLTVGFEDVEGWARAITELLQDDRELARISSRMDVLRSEFGWPEVTKPLKRLVAANHTSSARPPILRRAHYGWLRAQNAIHQHRFGAVERGLRAAAGRKRSLEERIQPRLP